MLTGSLLLQQTTEGLKPLGAFNQPVYRSHGQIRAALLNELDPSYANYFARPEFDQGTATISWFAHTRGKARRWIDLSAEEQARLDPIRQKMSEQLDEYRHNLAAAHENSPRNNFGKLLAQAVLTPSMDYLYVIGDQPVITFWGFKKADAREGVDPLRLTPGSTMLHPDRMEIPPEPGSRMSDPPVILEPEIRRPWWRWLLLPLGLLLPLALLFALLGWWFGWRFSPLLPFAGPRITLIAPERGPAVPSATPLLRPDMTPGLITPATTLAGGAGLLTHGGGPDGSGTTTVPPGGVTHPGATAAPRETALPPRTADAGRLPVMPELPSLPPPGVVNGPRGAPLVIPNGAPPGPAGFMQGVWRSRSGLMLNDNPTEEYYRFGSNGQGDVTIRSRDGAAQCSAPAQAVVGPDGQLRFREAKQLTCSDGTTVSGAVTTCRQVDGQAFCTGVNGSNGSQFRVQVERMRRQ